MNNHIKAEIALGLAIFLCLAFIAVDQYHKSLTNAVAEQTAEIKKQAQKQIDDALSARDKQYDSDMKAMDEKYARLQKMTPQQIVLKAPEYIPGLQGKPPIQIVGPDTAAAPIGSAIVPPESVKPLAQAILDGQKCSLDLGKCQGDQKDWQAKFDLKQQESDQWQKAAKGGSMVSKAWGCAKIGGFGAAAGALPNDANHRGRNAAYGFGLTFVPCMFIKHR